MKRKEQGVLLAGLLAIMLAACSSTGGGDVERANSSLSSEIDSSIPTAATAMPATGATGTSSGGTTASSASDSGQAGSAPVSASIAPNSTVTSIEVVHRQGGATGAGTVAGAAVGGSAAATTGERVYRITLRMDDGQTQVVTQEWAPTFTTGDRVRIGGNGAIQR